MSSSRGCQGPHVPLDNRPRAPMRRHHCRRRRWSPGGSTTAERACGERRLPSPSGIDAESRSRQGFGVSLSVDVLQRFRRRRRRRILCRVASGGFCPYTYRLCVPYSRVSHVTFKCRQRPTLGQTVSDSAHLWTHACADIRFYFPLTVHMSILCITAFLYTAG